MFDLSKKKILLWIEADLVHFFISYYLKDIRDSDFYAIIDITNRPKRFFQEQKLVPFKKIWFFHDHIKFDKKPDLQFLSTFEEKYDINLWKLAINEKSFYRFSNFHKFNDNEILSIQEHTCKFFEEVLDEVKPDSIITKDLVMTHHLEIFNELCKTKGLNVLMLTIPKIGFRCMISDQLEKISLKKDFENILGKNRDIKELKGFLESHSSRKQIKNFDIGKSFLQEMNSIKTFEKNNNYSNYGKTKNKLFFSLVKSVLREKYRRRFINTNLVNDVNYNCKFAYFPLGVDIGKEILISAPFYTNQIEIIRHIAKSLPVEYRLYVKEHPSSIIHDWRTVSEYKEIVKIPNVTLIHPSVESKKLYENCSLVFSISGSAGLEATFFQIPSIVFSEQMFNILPSVFRVEDVEQLPLMIKTALETKVMINDLDRYLTFIEKNTFNFDWFGLLVDIRKKFYFNKMPFDTDISYQEIELFLKENEEKLKMLAGEFSKKI
tara:strand:- start:712 stop:2184 length:1473 start_codon:yes stop_codon:yes gene_type:complete